MLWPRRSAKPNLNGRLLTLKCWAAGFALVTAVVMVAATTLGFGWSGLAWLPVLLGVFLLVVFMNLRAVHAAHDSAPSWSPPRWRIVLGVGLGLVVALAAILWIFAGDIENARDEKPVQWDQEVEKVRQGIRIATGIANLPVSTVDGHPDVRAKGAELAELKEKSDRAQEAAGCEQTGACAVHVVPEGDGVRGVKDHAKKLAADVLILEKELNALRTKVAQQIEGEQQQRTAALRRVTDLHVERGKLGPRPAPLATSDSVRTVGQRQVAAVGISSIGAFLVCLLVDLGVFLFIVRRVCRAEVPRK